MVTLIFATHEEAHETLNTTQAKKVATAFENELYTCQHGKILICGMGPKKTEEALRRHIDQMDAIVNIGIAGGLRTTISTCQLYPIASATMQMNQSSFHEIALQETGLKLITEHSPICDPKKRDRLSEAYDLVDMEGYIIAKIAKKHKKPCRLYKLVSDYCTPTMSDEIRRKLPELSMRLAYHANQIMLTK